MRIVRHQKGTASRECLHADCGNENPASARYCGRCGRALTGRLDADSGEGESGAFFVHPVSIVSMVAILAVVFLWTMGGGAWAFLPLAGIFMFGWRKRVGRG